MTTALASRPTAQQPDEARFRQAVSVIEVNRRRWDQNTYFSLVGGSYCFGGWVCYLAGQDVEAMLRGGGCVAVALEAARLLGLDYEDAMLLFNFTEVDGQHPTVEQLKEKITEVTGIEFS